MKCMQSPLLYMEFDKTPAGCLPCWFHAGCTYHIRCVYICSFVCFPLMLEVTPKEPAKASLRVSKILFCTGWIPILPLDLSSVEPQPRLNTFALFWEGPFFRPGGLLLHKSLSTSLPFQNHLRAPFPQYHSMLASRDLPPPPPISFCCFVVGCRKNRKETRDSQPDVWLSIGQPP